MRRPQLLLIAALLCAPAWATAQSGARPAAAPRSLLTRLKALPLAGHKPVSLSLGAQARWREELYRNFNTLPINDDNSQSRLLLSADLLAGRRSSWYGRSLLEWRDNQSYGRTLPGGARTQDADRHDVQALFVEAGHGASFLRVGRQEIALGRERLIGVPDWSNTRRGSQGARLQLVRGRLALEAVDAHPMLVRQSAPNRADSTQRFRTLSLGSAAGAKAFARGLPAIWQLYGYEQRLTPVSGAQTHRWTTGGRLQWQRGSTKSAAVQTLEFEGAWQSGRTGDRSLAAHFWVIEAQQQWRRVMGAPSLALGIEEASGENPASSNRLEGFAVLYPAAHAHGGYADVIGRTNVRELHAISSWDPVAALNLRAALYRFDRLRLTDGVYSKQNTLFRAAGNSQDRHVADELDLTGTWKMGRYWRMVFGGGVVTPGAFLRATTPIARMERWGFVGTTLIY